MKRWQHFAFHVAFAASALIIGGACGWYWR